MFNTSQPIVVRSLNGYYSNPLKEGERMGILPCFFLCHKDQESQSGSHCAIKRLSESSSYSSSSLLSSQASLPSVPSLTSPSREQLSTLPQCVAKFKGHTSPVFTLVLAGKSLYSGSSAGEIRSWSQNPSANASSADNVVATGNGAVKCLVVQGDKLISAHQDHKIRVWKMERNGTNQDHHKLKSLDTLPTFSDRLCASFSSKNYVQVRRHKKRTWVHHVDTVSSLAVSKDGSLLYSASWDRSFKVWRTSDFKCLESVGKAHDDAINAIVVSGDGLVYTGSADKKIKVWKKGMGEKKHYSVATLEKHKSAVNALALGSDGSVLYSGACDRSILVWQKVPEDQKEDGGDGGKHMVVAGALRGHAKAILCIAVAADIVFSGSADNSIRIWREGREEGYSCLGVLAGHRKPVKCLAVNSDDGDDGSSGLSSCFMVYSGSLDCDIRIWQVRVPLF